MIEYLDLKMISSADSEFAAERCHKSFLADSLPDKISGTYHQTRSSDWSGADCDWSYHWLAAGMQEPGSGSVDDTRKGLAGNYLGSVSLDS